MKRILLILIALFFSVSFANAQSPVKLCYTTNGANCQFAIAASNSIPVSISSGTTTELVPLSVGKQIFVTSWDVMSAGTGTIKLVYGTGSNCGTGTADLTGAYPLIAQAGIAKGNGLGVVLIVPKSNALCATTNASVQMSGSVSYAQFAF